MSRIVPGPNVVAGLATRRGPFRAFGLLALSLCVVACGGGGATTPPPFAVLPPSGGGTTPPPPTPLPPLPPPTPTAPPIFDPEAITHARTPLFGAFPSDLVRFGGTLFSVDADQIEAAGAWIRPYDLGPDGPVPSSLYVPAHIELDHLEDALGAPVDPLFPIGFGFYLNELEIASDRLGFVIASAGGSDSTPPLSNLIVFDPRTGQVLQTVNLCRLYATPDPISDSSGGAVPNGTFLQSAAEAIAFAPRALHAGTVYVAMSNLIVGAPSYGTTKYPGTIQAFDVDRARNPIVQTIGDPNALTTRTIRTHEFNPVSLDVLTATSAFGSQTRLIATLGGVTGYDASFRLVPMSPAAVAVYDTTTHAFLGAYELGLAGLVSRPALGRDGAGHHVGFFPSGVTGEVYALRLDGLMSIPLDPSRLAILRGIDDGISIGGALGTPAGNLAGVALAPDGDVLVVSGFGDLFVGDPGRLVLASLPHDLVADSAVDTTFVPGVSEFATVPGRALGALVLDPNPGSRPDVYVNLSGTFDASLLGSGPASVGSLTTHGLID